MVIGALERRVSPVIRGAALAACAVLITFSGLSPAVAAPGKAATKTKIARKATPTRKVAAKPASRARTAKTAAASKRRATTAKAAAPNRAAARPAARRTSARTAAAARAPRKSVGRLAGLHAVADPLGLDSGVALVLDQDSREVLLNKNGDAVLPVASITKLMTGLLISEANLPLGELITITDADVDRLKGSSSRLPVGSTLTRGELMHLALMSSENRAAHALGRTFPGGLNKFVSLMNARAIMLGMTDTRYVEPTGLSSENRSSARDLATLVAKTSQDPLLRTFSTSTGYELSLTDRVLKYNNTNGLVFNQEWDIGLQKTGYISEAGRCMVLQTRVGDRKLIMVLLDSTTSVTRLGDAKRMRAWVEQSYPGRSTVAAQTFDFGG